MSADGVMRAAPRMPIRNAKRRSCTSSAGLTLSAWTKITHLVKDVSSIRGIITHLSNRLDMLSTREPLARRWSSC